jgi:ELWxxDGT repeat protein
MEPRVLLSNATLVKDINTGPAVGTVYTLGAIGNWAVFAEDDAVHGVELWRSNGTKGGTFRLKDINPGPDGSNPQLLITVGTTMYFTANDGTGASLWKTDGNASGTIELAHVDTSFALCSERQQHDFLRWF